jgi:putative transposase
MHKPTTFDQIIKLVDAKLISSAVQNHKSDKYSKVFSTHQHLSALVFSQLSSCRSIRDLEIRFSSHCSRVVSFRYIKRSTLSYANGSRSYKVFEEIAHALMQRHSVDTCVKGVLSLLDSTSIRVCGRGSNWAEKTKTRTCRGVKVHIQYRPGVGLEECSISASNVNDLTEALSFELEPNKIYVFDKGYYDFNWWNRIDECGSSFVTRIKSNTSYKIIEERAIDPISETKIVSDQIITLSNKKPRGGKINLLAEKPLRLVVCINPEDKKRYTFISNLLTHKASEIAEYYKKRWGIELLFKWIKQNLNVKRFLGENENAIRMQLYVAIIVYILIGLIKRMGLTTFTREIDILSWIKINIFSRGAWPKPPPPTLLPHAKAPIEQL